MPSETEIDEIKASIESLRSSLSSENILCYSQLIDKLESVSLFQFGLKPPDNLPSPDKIQHAKGLIDSLEEKRKHSERRESVETAIKMLEGMRTKLDADDLCLLARGYLYRSLLIIPKGRTIPEEKRRFIEEGIKIIEDAITIAEKAKEDNSEAWRLNAILRLELACITTVRVDVAVLRTALSHSCTKFNEKTEDVRIAVAYCEANKGGSKGCLQGIIASKLKGIELEKAKAYLLTGDKAKLEAHFNRRVIGRLLKSPFSAPVWVDTVEFIKTLRHGKNEVWKDFTKRVYDVCKHKEKKTANLHLRWHWSRLRDLYDLAFLAVATSEEKARIADSCKSRPALTWKAWEEMAKGDPKYREFIEAEATGVLRGYIKDIGGVFAAEAGVEESSRKTDVADIPAGLTVVHFYLNQLERRENIEKWGHALIYNQKKEDKWEEKTFDPSGILDSYMAWQTNYAYASDKRDSSESLVDLCKKVGEEMPFLFELPNEIPVVFIPHDFLHRLPLHGAIKTGGGRLEVFLEKRASTYLPAWPYAHKEEGSKHPDGFVILKNFPDYDYNSLMCPVFWTNDIKKAKDNKSDADDLKGITRAPKLLTILCHGKADAVNPFNAKLKLAGKGITHLEILKSDRNLNGSTVILGACETDLVPSLTDALDEHLSITTALLNKGASQIIGTMWEANPERIEEIVKLPNIEEMGMILTRQWQAKKVETWKEKKCNPIVLYSSLVFRNIGLNLTDAGGKECL